MTVPPFALLLLAIPVLLLGEQLVARVKWLGRSNIPAPIIGGLIVAVIILIVNELRPGSISIYEKTQSVAWLWAVLPQWSFATPNPTTVERPLLILFFTCIGLNASWGVAKKGSWQLLWYLALATMFALVMNTVGVITAKAIGQDALLGVMCSGVSLMGGFGTSAAFAGEFEKAGLAGAATIGIAAAAFGVIAGGLIAGPVAGRLIARNSKHWPSPEGEVPAGARGFEVETIKGQIAPSAAGHPVAPTFEGEELIDTGGFLDDVRSMIRNWPSTLVHLTTLLICLKLGVFVSVILSQYMTFPVYIGAMLVAALIRNIHDIAGGKFLDSLRIDLIASFALAWLLSVVMITLKLGELVHTAGPMLIILAVQIILIAAFAYSIVFRAMGRDYEAAAMSAGFIGFAAGATSNAVATMKQLARRFGPAPRAFLIVTVVGAFLIDFTNAFLITAFLNWFKH